MNRVAVTVAVVLAAVGCRFEQPPPPAPVEERVELPGVPWLTVNDHPKRSVRGGPPSESYNRERDWMPGGWTDPDRNGCDTREDTLIRESLTVLRCERGRVTGAGVWWRVYVSGQTTSPAALEIDHVVALADAWRSGGWRWPVERMRQYAQDPRVLWAVDGQSNQAKSDDGPDLWRPENRLVWCTYAQREASIKAAYNLTVTWAELGGLRELLRSC